MKIEDMDMMGLSAVLDDGPDLIPLLSQEDEDKINKEEVPDILPILPLRNTVLFPGVVLPITVGRDKSIKLVNDAYNSNKIIGVIAQKSSEIESPKPEELNSIGTVANILKMLKMPDGSTTIIIQGRKRFRIKEMIQDKPYYKASIDILKDINETFTGKNFDALIGSIKDLALTIIKQSPNIPSEASIAIKNIESPSFLINFISSNMNIDIEAKQKLLEIFDLKARAEAALGHLTKELQMLEIKNDIQSKARSDIEMQQREYFLHQQMKTIQDELGDNPMEQEVEELAIRAKKKKWNKTVEKAFNKELDKIQRMNMQSAEYSIQLNYLDTLLDLPWDHKTTDKFDLAKAEKTLDKDHFGLEKVKERIIEHLAVLKLKGDMKAPILCLYGPPGVGKTSLGKSIAKSIGRKYVRMSLGGMRDEAEIRGHRKTYIGALPGRILQSIKKAGASNPVFILDELDKVGSSGHGDPSSALLEVLDPEQNQAFYDNFVEIDYDLSDVMFIATANSLSTIPSALRDRLEIIEVSGYTVEEKIEIVKTHLLPKQLKEHGLTKAKLKLSDVTIEKVIEEYTRESGVRTLEKRIAKLCRVVAKKVAMDEVFNGKVSPEDLTSILGPGFGKEKYDDNSKAGVVTGLAWTAVGGDILFIESSLTKGKGKLTLTGNLGDVMKESAVIALEYLKSHAHKLGLKQAVFDQYNVHLHVPEGATPKDGPSAGITMVTALASLFTQRKVKSKIAMTGEITLRGKVLPVGGIKEKLLAAKRAGINTIILSEENRKNVEEIKKEYLEGVKFKYVKEMLEVIDIALLDEKVKDAVTVELTK